MEFYKIESWAIGGQKYPWSSSYGPLDDMPFHRWMTPKIRSQKEEFWKLNPRPPGMNIDPGGRQWSDIIGNGGMVPFFFVSDKVVNDLRESGVEIMRATEMPIATIKAKRLQSILPPKYFVLEAHPGIDVDWTAMGVPTDNNNRAITNPYPTPWPPKQWIVARSSWSGSDLMSYRNWQIPMTLVCTEKIKKLAEEKNWTNIKFTPIESS